MQELIIQGQTISLFKSQETDYISLTDMTKGFGDENSIYNWMRNRDTLEFLGLWEIINNDNFKGIEFDTFRSQAGLNSFTLTPQKWINATNAIGIASKSGRYGGTYAHKDIAFEFASWLNPSFKLYLIKEFQRLKEIELSPSHIEWDMKRLISKSNYHIHTDSIKEFIIPQKHINPAKEWLIYAEEADLLNYALFGYTAREWKISNPDLSKNHNMRDYATINELIVFSNLESQNSELIKLSIPKQKRLEILQKMALQQLDSLNKHNINGKFTKLINSKSELLPTTSEIDKPLVVLTRTKVSKKNKK